MNLRRTVLNNLGAWNKQIQVIHRWIQNSGLQLRSGLTVNRLLNMSTYGF